MPARTLEQHILFNRVLNLPVHRQMAWMDGRHKVISERKPWIREGELSVTGRYKVYFMGGVVGTYPSFASAIREADRRARAPRA